MAHKDEATKLQVLVERLKASESRALLRLVKELETSTAEVLAHEELSSLTATQIARVLILADSKVKFLGTGLLAEYRSGLEKFAMAQAELESKLWGNGHTLSPQLAAKRAFDIPLGIDGPDRGRAIDAYLENWWNQIRSSVFGALRRGAYEKKSNTEIRREIIGVRNLNFRDGLIDSLRRNAVTTSNTAVQHVYSSVRELMLELTGLGVLWSALLEKNTCARCRSLDGRFFNVRQGPRSPLHTGCRCVMIPAEPGEVLSRDTYFSWLKEQSFDFVSEALGRTRAELFLNGGISAERFGELQLDKKFEPLTLEQLRKVAPSVFLKAGI